MVSPVGNCTPTNSFLSPSLPRPGGGRFFFVRIEKLDRGGRRGSTAFA